jgi:hypothetical protein
LLIAGGITLFTTPARGEWTARFGVPLGELDTNEWFNSEADTNYRYDYEYYDSTYYPYYNPGYDTGTYGGDWYYDNYDNSVQCRPADTGQSRNYYQGGYNNQNSGNDWYYDFYAPATPSYSPYR